MLNKKMKALAVSLAMSLTIMGLITGCGGPKDPVETEIETETETETEIETETETETETELQTDIAYTSQDKSIRITLPDNTWKVTQDVDEMRVFSSGASAMINIVHAANANEMKNVTVAASEEALTESLTKQYAESNAFEVVKFEQLSSDTMTTCEYVVKYNSTSMWAYAVTYAIMAEDEAYVITGTVTDDNKVLLEAVQKSVESFTVLNNPKFGAFPGTVVNEKDKEKESESESEADVSKEMQSLSEYGSNVKLYASDVVNVREKPSTDSEVIGGLNLGDEVTVTGETSQWFQVSIYGNKGYVSKSYLVYNKSAVPAETTQTNGTTSSDMANAEMNTYYDYGGGYTYYATSDVNMRSQPGTDSDVVGGANAGDAITVVGETDNWYVVSVNGNKAYISKSYVSTSDPGYSTGGNGNAGDDYYSDMGTVSGTVVDATANTLTIAGDDGNTYTVNYSDAYVSTNDGLYNGLYVSATVDYSATSSSGTLYATDVNGY